MSSGVQLILHSPDNIRIVESGIMDAICQGRPENVLILAV
jgi:hypothetical protein